MSLAHTKTDENRTDFFDPGSRWETLEPDPMSHSGELILQTRLKTLLEHRLTCPGKETTMKSHPRKLRITFEGVTALF